MSFRDFLRGAYNVAQEAGEQLAKKSERWRNYAYQCRSMSDRELLEAFRDERDPDKRTGMRFEIQRRRGEMDDNYCSIK